MAISEKILKSFDISASLFVEIEGLKYLPYRLMWGNHLQGYNRNSVQAVLSRLYKQGLINKKVKDGKVYLKVSDLGTKFLDKRHNRISLSLSEEPGKWDGLYRFICFDIPEEQRDVRDTLRKALKDIGAVCWQKSIWVTKLNITRALNEFFDNYGLADECSVLEVKEIYSSKLKHQLELS